VVVFGNPLSGFAGSTLEKAGATSGGRTKSFCGQSDPVCGGNRNGNVQGSHLSYPSNGALDQAAAFAAGKITADRAHRRTGPAPVRAMPEPAHRGRSPRLSGQRGIGCWGSRASGVIGRWQWWQV
jgi:Cutinase